MCRERLAHLGGGAISTKRTASPGARPVVARARAQRRDHARVSRREGWRLPAFSELDATVSRHPAPVIRHGAARRRASGRSDRAAVIGRRARGPMPCRGGVAVVRLLDQPFGDHKRLAVQLQPLTGSDHATVVGHRPSQDDPPPRRSTRITGLPSYHQAVRPRARTAIWPSRFPPLGRLALPASEPHAHIAGRHIAAQVPTFHTGAQPRHHQTTADQPLW